MALHCCHNLSGITELILLFSQYTIPFLLSILDYIRNQRTKRANFQLSGRAVFPNVANRFNNGNLHYVISAAILASTGLTLSSISNNHRSTYICPINSHGAFYITVVKFASLLLDTFGLVSVVELFRRRGNDWGRSTLQLFGIILLVSIQLSDFPLTSLSHIILGRCRSLVTCRLCCLPYPAGVFSLYCPQLLPRSVYLSHSPDFHQYYFVMAGKYHSASFS